MSQSTNTKIPAATAARGSKPSSPDKSSEKPKPPRIHRNKRLCRTSEYKPPGSDRVGLSKDNQPSKVVWELPYGLKKKQYEDLCDRFPGIAFVQVGTDCHDHPISHTSYRVVWENVLTGLEPGWKVADISGNPSVNENFNRRQVGRAKPTTIDTFCQVTCPKDSVRAKTRWGPKVAADGQVRWEETTLYDMYRNDRNKERFATYDCFLLNQVLYYYPKYEMNRLLQLNPNAIAICTIHKLPGQTGTINCGEQEYHKNGITGHVKQTNVETGEFYEHPDPAGWFKDFCYADEHGAIAWTINKGCDDTYKVIITSTNPELVPDSCWLNGTRIFRGDHEEVVRVETAAALVDPPPAYPKEVVTIRTRDFLPNSLVDKTIEIEITHPELYDALNKFMINKPRTHVTLKDLTAKANREAGNNPLFNRGRTKMNIDPKTLTQHIFAAWRSGVGIEQSLFASVLTDPDVSSVNRNLAGKTLSLGSANYAKQFTRYALAISSVARSKDPVHQVLAQFDELL